MNPKQYRALKMQANKIRRDMDTAVVASLERDLDKLIELHNLMNKEHAAFWEELYERVHDKTDKP